MRASLRARIGEPEAQNGEEAPRRGRRPKAEVVARETAVEGVQMLASAWAGLAVGNVGDLPRDLQEPMAAAVGGTLKFAELVLLKHLGPDAIYLEEIGLGAGIATIGTVHAIAWRRGRAARKSAVDDFGDSAAGGGQDDAGAGAGPPTGEGVA